MVKAIYLEFTINCYYFTQLVKTEVNYNSMMRLHF